MPQIGRSYPARPVLIRRAAPVGRTATASLTLSAAADTPALGPSGATASLTLSAAGTGSVPLTPAASLTLTAAAATRAPVTSTTASIGLAATGVVAQLPTTSGALSLTASAGIPSARVSAVSGALSLTAAAAGQANLTPTAALSLTADLTTSRPATGTGQLAMAAAASTSATASGATAALDLTGTLSASLGAQSTASITLTGQGTASQAPNATGTFSLTAVGAAKVLTGATGSLILAGAGTVSYSTSSSGSVALSAAATSSARGTPAFAGVTLTASTATVTTTAGATGLLTLTAAGSASGVVPVFDPIQLPDKALVFDAAALSALNDGDLVASWPDLSGNGRTLAQNTGTRQPVYRAAGLNGQPCVEFDGIDDNLNINLGATALALPQRTVYVVGELTALPSAVGVVFGSGSEWYVAATTLGRMHSSIRNTAGTQSTRSGNAGSELNQGPAVATWVSDVATLGDPAATVTRTYWRNGTNYLTSTSDTTGETTTTGATWVLAALNNLGASPAPLRISALWVFAEAHDTTTRAQVETYLAARYGITAYAPPVYKPGASASLSLGADVSTAQVRPTVTGSLQLTGTAVTQQTVSAATALLALSAAVPIATARTTATGSLSLGATVAAMGRATLAAVLALQAQAAAAARPTATGNLTLAATGQASLVLGSGAQITLLALLSQVSTRLTLAALLTLAGQVTSMTWVSPTPPERTFKIRREDRTIRVAAEPRTVRVRPDRQLEVSR